MLARIAFAKTDEQPLHTSPHQGIFSHEKAATYWLSVTIIVTALWMALGDFHKNHNGDSIILSLISQQHWTPYFWGSNRYGMLVPLLAKPFQDPLANLIVIVFVGTLSGLACSFVLMKYFFPESELWYAAAALQNIWLLALTTASAQFDWFVVQCYGVSLLLGFTSLILLDKRRFWSALFLLLVTHWVNSAALVVLLPLLLLHHLLEHRLRDLFQSVIVLGVSAAVGIVAMRLAPYKDTNTGLLPAQLWPDGWGELLQMTHRLIVPNATVLLWMIVPSLLCLSLLLFGWSGRHAVQVAFGLCLIGIAYWLFSGALVWVKMSIYYPRYVYISLLLFSLALSIVIVAVLDRFVRGNRWVGIVFTGVMFIAAAAIYGTPSIAKVHKDIDDKYGRLTPDILASGVELISGDYWMVWPAVFHADLILYERGEDRRIYGLSYRYQSTFSKWLGEKSVCVAVPISANGADAARGRTYWLSQSPRSFTYRRSLSLFDEFCETE
jgi:hypothetical protein